MPLVIKASGRTLTWDVHTKSILRNKVRTGLWLAHLVYNEIPSSEPVVKLKSNNTTNLNKSREEQDSIKSYNRGQCGHISTI